MQLLTAGTPNGWKVTIMLEELVEEGLITPADFEVNAINLLEGEQFSEAFTAHNLNQKIPVLIDGELSLMESCAILHYLAEKYRSVMLRDADRWQVLQWLYWQAANVGPAFGNKLSYTRYMPDVPDIEKQHPLERFRKEARRLSAVLEKQLEQGPFVAGEQFSIADIAIYPWLRGWKWSKVDITDRPLINAWIERVRSRPAVERGLIYGTDKAEVDQWSEERKRQYAQTGASIASNDKLNTEL